MSNSNLANAYKIVQIQKAFKRTFNQAPSQTKPIISFTIPLLLGLVIYSFIKSPKIQLILLGVMMFLVGGILYSFIQDPAEKWIIFVSFIAGILFWFYVFYNSYKKQLEAESVGKKTFICNPTGKCDTDGTDGPFDGLKTYVYEDGKVKEIGKIPANKFDVRNSDKFTYMFWLKIDYDKWKSKNMREQDKIILLKGNSIESSDLAVWMLPLSNTIQFDVDNPHPVSVGTKFPFGQWVHYALVVNNTVVELYKNATLERSAVINKRGLNKTPLYVGNSSDAKYNNFPGKMLYLTYNNINLTPSEIYEIYNREYFNIQTMESPTLIQKSCEGKCDKGNGAEDNGAEDNEVDDNGVKMILESPNHLETHLIKPPSERMKELNLHNFSF